MEVRLVGKLTNNKGREGTGRKESREHEASDEARQDGRSKERRV